MVQCGGCWKRRTTSPGLLGNMYFTTTAATGRALGAPPTHPRRNGVYTFGGGLLGRPGAARSAEAPLAACLAASCISPQQKNPAPRPPTKPPTMGWARKVMTCNQKPTVPSKPALALCSMYFARLLHVFRRSRKPQRPGPPGSLPQWDGL